MTYVWVIFGPVLQRGRNFPSQKRRLTTWTLQDLSAADMFVRWFTNLDKRICHASIFICFRAEKKVLGFGHAFYDWLFFTFIMCCSPFRSGCFCRDQVRRTAREKKKKQKSFAQTRKYYCRWIGRHSCHHNSVVAAQRYLWLRELQAQRIENADSRCDLQKEVLSLYICSNGLTPQLNSKNEQLIEGCPHPMKLGG